MTGCMDTFSFAGVDVQTIGAVVVAAIILAVVARVLAIFSAVVTIIRVAAFLAVGCIVVAMVVYANELLSGNITADDVTQFRHSAEESWPEVQEFIGQVLPDPDDIASMTVRAGDAGRVLLGNADDAE